MQHLFCSAMLRRYLLTVALCALVACGGTEGRQASHLQRAWQFYSQGSYELAGMEAKNVLQINADNAGARYLLALLYEQKGDISNYRKSLHKAVLLDPALLDARLKLAQLLLDEQLPGQALVQVDAVLGLSASNIDAQGLRASILLQMGDEEGALMEARRVLELDPSRLDAVAVLIEVYQDERASHLIELLQELLQRQAGNDALSFLLAAQYELAGDYASAKAIYESLLERNPNALHVVNNLAVVLVERFPSAANIRKAGLLAEQLRGEPEPAFIDTRAWVNYQLGRYPEAVSLLEPITQDPSTPPEFAYHLGMAYYKIGQLDKAKIALQQAVVVEGSSYHGYEEARRVLKKL